MDTPKNFIANQLVKLSHNTVGSNTSLSLRNTCSSTDKTKQQVKAVAKRRALRKSVKLMKRKLK